MKKSEVRSDLKESTNQLLNSLSDFPDELFTSKVQEDKWSVGQIADHLKKVETSVLNLFTGSTRPADRAPDIKIADLKKRFLDYSTKMKAYGPIIPEQNPPKKQDALAYLQDIRQRLTGMVEIEDLTELLTGFEHPVFGYMTRLEWIYFVVYHSRRHIAQIRDLEKNFSKK